MSLPTHLGSLPNNRCIDVGLGVNLGPVAQDRSSHKRVRTDGYAIPDHAELDDSGGMNVHVLTDLVQRLGDPPSLQRLRLPENL